MKKTFLFIVLLAAITFSTPLMAQDEEKAAPQFKVVTVVESIVPMGLGRSRMIENKEDVNVDDYTTERSDGKDSKQNKVNRKNLKIDNFSETKLLNFYSGVGINFQNIASNDALISDKINQLAEEGWVLIHVTSGVESQAGSEDSNGIFITRMFFKKM